LPDECDSGLFCTDHHRSKLEHVKRLSVESDPLGSIEHWAMAIQFDQDGDDDEEWPQH
jgi:hypothetical protein